MSLKRNILANYASQLYITAASILMVPLYIKYMGPEAYGLVGFFAMLQAFFNMLDMGLTPTIARESARFHGGAMSQFDYLRLARAMGAMFATIGLLGGLLLFTLANPIANQWLNASQLPRHDVTLALQLMAIIIALRWMCGFYRGVITGAERLAWLSSFSGLIATGRFFLVLPVLMFISASPQVFFIFQLGVALLEIAGLAWMGYKLLPDVPIGQRIHWEWAPLKPVLKFSLTIAFTSSVWMFVTQVDKLVLSRILSLADYGYFTVAVLVSSSIMIVSGPISSAIMPRMARLQAVGQYEEIIAAYRKATQLVTVTAIPAALLLIFLAPKILWAWSGDSILVERAAPVLSLYAIGYAFLAVSAFPYYLQYAKGNLRLHLQGSALFVALLIPCVIWAADRYGMIGAGWAWAIANAMYFFLWTPVVHRELAPGLHIKWLMKDILKPSILPLVSVVLISNIVVWNGDRSWMLLELMITGCALLLMAYLMASELHIRIRQ